MFSLEASTAHDLQYRLFTPFAPQTSQIFVGRGTGFILNSDEFHYLGKEVERKREAGDNLADILMEPPLEYKPPKHRSPGSRRKLHPAVIEKLKARFSIKQLARKARLDRDVIRRAFRGKLIQLRSCRLLMRVYEDMQ